MEKKGSLVAIQPIQNMRLVNYALLIVNQFKLRPSEILSVTEERVVLRDKYNDCSYILEAQGDTDVLLKCIHNGDMQNTTNITCKTGPDCLKEITKFINEMPMPQVSPLQVQEYVNILTGTYQYVQAMYDLDHSSFGIGFTIDQKTYSLQYDPLKCTLTYANTSAQLTSLTQLRYIFTDLSMSSKKLAKDDTYLIKLLAKSKDQNVAVDTAINVAAAAVPVVGQVRLAKSALNVHQAMKDGASTGQALKQSNHEQVDTSKKIVAAEAVVAATVATAGVGGAIATSAGSAGGAAVTAGEAAAISATTAGAATAGTGAAVAATTGAGAAASTVASTVSTASGAATAASKAVKLRQAISAARKAGRFAMDHKDEIKTGIDLSKQTYDSAVKFKETNDAYKQGEITKDERNAQMKQHAEDAYYNGKEAAKVATSLYNQAKPSTT